MEEEPLFLDMNPGIGVATEVLVVPQPEEVYHILLDVVNNSSSKEMLVESIASLESVLNNLGNEGRSCKLLLWDELVKAAATRRACTKRP